MLRSTVRQSLGWRGTFTTQGSADHHGARAKLQRREGGDRRGTPRSASHGTLTRQALSPSAPREASVLCSSSGSSHLWRRASRPDFASSASSTACRTGHLPAAAAGRPPTSSPAWPIRPAVPAHSTHTISMSSTNQGASVATPIRRPATMLVRQQTGESRGRTTARPKDKRRSYDTHPRAQPGDRASTARALAAQYHSKKGCPREMEREQSGILVGRHCGERRAC